MLVFYLHEPLADNNLQFSLSSFQVSLYDVCRVSLASLAFQQVSSIQIQHSKEQVSAEVDFTTGTVTDETNVIGTYMKALNVKNQINLY